MKIIEVTEIGKYLDVIDPKMCCMFIGDTGIGKTQCITNWAKEKGYYIKSLVLSQLEASETLGIPVQDKYTYNGVEYNTIDTAIPKWVFELAAHQDTGAVLYLDEFLCAEPAVMNSFLNFLSERAVGNIDLSNVIVVASTNIGNYTYDPDKNMVSRFCMFYTINTTYSAYLNNKYKNAHINNMYKDEEEREGILFEPRSLKPRCQEMLCLLKDKSFIPDFYEGYTNMLYMPQFHSNNKLNAVVSTFVEVENGKYVINDDDIDRLAALIYQKVAQNSQRKNLVDYCTTFKNLTYNRGNLWHALNRIINNN